MRDGTRAKIGIFAASLGSMCYFVPSSLLSNIAADFPEKYGTLIQMLITLPGLVAIVVAVIVGQLSHVLPKRAAVLGSTVCILAGGLLQALAPHSLPVLIAGCCIMGVGLGGLLTDNAALISDCFSGKECATVMGLQSAFISGGGAFVTFLGGQLGKGDWTKCFWAYLFYILVLIVEIIFLPKGKLSAAPEKGKKAERLPGEVYLISVLGFLFFLFLNVFMTNISSMVQTVRGLGGPNEASYASTAYNVAGMVAGLFVGAITARLHRKIMGSAVALGTLGLLLTFLSHNLVLTCLGGMCCGASFAIFMPSGNFFSSEAAGANNGAKAISIYSAISNLGLAVSPIVIRFLTGDRISGRFLLAAIVCACVSVCLFLTFRDRKKAAA